MSLLTGALGRLLKTAESFVAGWLAVLVAQHAPFISIGRDQILSGITFLVVTVAHAVHAHGWDKLLVSYVKTLAAPVERALGPTIVGDIVKELTALLDRAESGLTVPVTISTSSKAPETEPAPAPTGASTTSTAGSIQPATSTPTSTPATTG